MNLFSRLSSPSLSSHRLNALISRTFDDTRGSSLRAFHVAKRTVKNHEASCALDSHNLTSYCDIRFCIECIVRAFRFCAILGGWADTVWQGSLTCVGDDATSVEQVQSNIARILLRARKSNVLRSHTHAHAYAETRAHTHKHTLNDRGTHRVMHTRTHKPTTDTHTQVHTDILSLSLSVSLSSHTHIHTQTLINRQVQAHTNAHKQNHTHAHTHTHTHSSTRTKTLPKPPSPLKHTNAMRAQSSFFSEDCCKRADLFLCAHPQGQKNAVFYVLYARKI